jgi:sugar lactone lactonase YvrE
VKSYLAASAALSLLLSTVSAYSQVAATAFNSAPDLAYEAVPGFFHGIPAGDYMGELQGVATNSKGHVFAFHRGPNTRLWEFDQTGKFVREIGKDFYGFMFAHSVRIDRHDNIWTVDEGTNVVTKLDPTGSKVLMVIGSHPDAAQGPVATSRAPNAPAEKYTLCRPTDVAWDQQDNIFISDGYCNNRVVKYDRNGRFLAQNGSEKVGKGENEYNLPHGLQVDHAGNVYVADRGNARYVVLDNNLKWKTSYNNVGSAWSACISEGPHQYLFATNSNPNGNAPGSWKIGGQIYKMELDGTVIGKFGHAGKLEPGFQVVHMMDCRDPNQMIAGEIESWRMQKFVLRGTANAKGSK